MKLLSHYLEYQTKRDPRIVNWENHLIGSGLSYSCRDTVYDRDTYPSSLHYHDYYELVVVEAGEMHYICEGSVYRPQRGDVVLIPPARFHMSVIDGETTRYKRHVFYLYPSAFEAIGHGELTAFLNRTQNGALLSFGSADSVQRVMETLEQLKNACEQPPSPFKEAWKLSHLLQLFCLLNQNDCRLQGETATLPENIRQLQRYIDRHYAEISSVSQVAEHFFYSREYVSRLFRKYFDTTITDYITKRRVAQSQSLIAQGLPLIDVAYRVGFGSLSTFIRSFRAVAGMTPSEYRKMLGK